MGPDGAIGLNSQAVDMFMDYEGVDKEERLDFWLKVKLIASHVIKAQRDDAKEKAKNKGH